jgi:hypothetical protein
VPLLLLLVPLIPFLLQVSLALADVLFVPEDHTVEAIPGVPAVACVPAVLAFLLLLMPLLFLSFMLLLAFLLLNSTAKSNKKEKR